MPESQRLTIDCRVERPCLALGDRTYTAMILQNLIENARKYNRPGGTIRIVAKVEQSTARCRIGNNGPPIAADAQADIFERFNRGVLGENLPGYGLGLNLARELARIHGGTLLLLQSKGDWTEFELALPAGRP